MISRIFIYSKVSDFLHKAHDWVTYIAIALLLLSAVPHISINPDALHNLKLDWKVVVGIAIITLARVVRLLVQLELRENESVLLEAPQNYNPGSDRLRLKTDLDGDADLRRVARLSVRAFPTGPFSDRSFEKKLDSFKRWHQCCRNSIWLVERKYMEHTICGMSILLPINKDTYINYRNAQSEPWGWGKNDIETDPDKIQYIFYGACYLNKSVGSGCGRFLSYVFLSHLQFFQRTKDLVVICPRKSTAGKQNATTMGFEFIRTSDRGFPLFELDLRKVDELGSAAQAVHEILRGSLLRAAT
jgi:hypothetical protein